MKRLSILTCTWLLAVRVLAEGIPEPGLTLYGVIKNDIGGATVRMTSGTLTWTIIPPSGPPVTRQVPLANINDQFSYAINIPCESPIAGVAATSNALQIRATAQTFNRAQIYIGTNLATIVPPARSTFVLSTADRATVERVDLALAAPEPDSDGDGLPDAWEAFYFGGYANPDDDDDGDGVSNRREYLAGTDPWNELSVLEFVKVEQAAGGVNVVTWSSQPGRYYKMTRSDSLLTGFVPVAGGIVGTPPQNVYTNAGATNGTYFYRVEIE